MSDNDSRSQLLGILRKIVSESVNRDVVPSDSTVCRALLVSMPSEFIDDALNQLMKEIPDNLKPILEDIVNNE